MKSFRQHFKESSSDKTFDNWFKDSKVVDENNNPLKVYRGVQPNNSFNTTSFTFHSPSKHEASSYALGGDVYVSYLSIKNPYLAEEGITNLSENRVKELQSKGYDGAGLLDSTAMIFGKKKVREWVAFDNSQIKVIDKI